MINREFWEKIASVWGKENEVVVPDVPVDIPVPKEFIETEKKHYDDLDDFLKDIIDADPDIEEIDITGFFS